MAYTVRVFHAKLLAEQLAQVPKELLDLIRSYLMIGWKEFIMAPDILRCHSKYLKHKLRGPNAKNVLIALQNYIKSECIEMKHDKERCDAYTKLKMFNSRERKRLTSLHNSKENLKKDRDLSFRTYDIYHKLVILIYEGYVVVNDEPRLESELTEEEHRMGPHRIYNTYRQPTYFTFYIYKWSIYNTYRNI